MQIKRYIAPTMREAIAQVREQQGPDAVILSNRRTQEGMEVVAAVDYDETLVSSFLVKPAVTRAATPAGDPGTQAPAKSAGRMDRLDRGGRSSSEDEAPPLIAPPVAKVELQDPGIARMREEMQSLRQMLESQLAGLAWNDLGRRHPLKAKVLRDLASLDIHPEVARDILREMPEIDNLRDSWKIPLSLLARRIPVGGFNVLDHGGVVAAVGATGVGKTTTLAKLAARFALKHGARNVALVSTDTYRIGAREQLQTYARILNVPMHVVQDREDLKHVLDALTGRKLVLIDTAGMSQRDMRLNEQFETLKDSGRIQVLLALSAAADAASLDETIRMFKRVKPAGCVLTKLDEAASLGAPLSALIRHGLSLSYICNGQKVPEDLHLATGKRAWMVETAVKLRRHSGHVADEGYLADPFARVAMGADKTKTGATTYA